MSITKSNTRMLEGEDLTLTGSLGIGTSSPTSGLHVKDDANTGFFGNVVATFEDSANDFPALSFKGTSGHLFAMRCPGSGGMVFADTSANTFNERMRIDSSGNVIISSIPTSSSGLPSGAIYSDGGTLKIV